MRVPESLKSLDLRVKDSYSFVNNNIVSLHLQQEAVNDASVSLVDIEPRRVTPCFFSSFLWGFRSAPACEVKYFPLNGNLPGAAGTKLLLGECPDNSLDAPGSSKKPDPSMSASYLAEFVAETLSAARTCQGAPD